MDFLAPHRPPFLLDGATGTLLVARGLPPGVPSAAANVERPDLVRSVAREYAEAGAQVITANSFAPAGPWPEGHPAAGRGPELSRLAIRLAREGAGQAETRGGGASDHGPAGRNPDGRTGRDAGRKPVRIAANLGPVRAAGSSGDLDGIVVPLFEAMAEEAPDALLLETQVCRADAARCTELARSTFGPGVAVLVGFAVREDGRTIAGETVTDAGRAAEDSGADAVGVGCSGGPASLVAAVRELARVTSVPVFAKPSAGVPDAAGRHPVSDNEFVGATVMLVAAGASLVGGCCGTTPLTIAKLTGRLRARTVPYGSD